MKKNDLLLLARIAMDSLAIIFAWIASFSLRFSTFFTAPKGVPPYILYLKLLPFIMVIWFAVFHASGFYRRSAHRRSVFLETLDTLQSCIVALLVFISFTYFYNEYQYSRGVLLVFAFLQIPAVVFGRSLIRKLNRWYFRKVPPSGSLLIASRPMLGQALRLTRSSSVGYGVVQGIVFFPEDEHSSTLAPGLKDLTMQWPSDWTDFLVKKGFHQAIISASHESWNKHGPELRSIIDQLTNVKIIPDFGNISQVASGFDIDNGIPFFSAHESPMDGIGILTKRLFDFLFSTLFLLLLTPFLLFLAFLVKLSSPGPILFKQRRIGMDGREFDCLKFRSMPVDIESKSGPVWAKKEDFRATQIGTFLRRFSLDELPQLINVIKGEMSLVGPRPERPVFVNKFRKDVPGYMLRHRVKAGLTGWAQVNGLRGDTSIEKRIEYDLYYIQNWSLRFDLKILVYTAYEVFWSRNAY